MGYVPTYTETEDWIDDVIDNTIADPALIVGPAVGDRYIIATTGNQAISNVLHTLTMAAAGYTACVAGDIGNAVADTVTGTGTLLAYNNATRVWLVMMTTPYTVGAVASVTLGTGIGTIATDTRSGFFVAGADLTLVSPAGDVGHVRSGAAGNRGWYEVATITFDGANTTIQTVEVPPNDVVAATTWHYSVTGTDWAGIGVDRVTVWDGANWILADTPTAGTTCMQTTINQPILFGGSTWALFAAVVDHTALLNLLVGDSGHTQFVMLAGRAGSQIIDGGTAASEDLTLNSTSNGTKGTITLQEAVDIIINPATDLEIMLNSARTVYLDATQLLYQRTLTGKPFYLDQYSSTLTDVQSIQFRKSADNTMGTLARTGNTDMLMDMQVWGCDATPARKLGARIYARQNGATGTQVPTDLMFETYSSTQIWTDLLRLTNGGRVDMRANQLRLYEPSNALNWSDTWVEEVTTLDAVSTELTRFALVDNKTYFIEATIVGMKSDSSARGAWHISACVYRDGAGAVLQGAVQSMHTEASVVGIDATIDVNGNNCRIMVTGVNPEEWHWTGKQITTEVV